MGIKHDVWGPDEEDGDKDLPAPIFSADGLKWMLVIVLLGLMVIMLFAIHDLSVQLNHLQSICRTK